MTTLNVDFSKVELLRSRLGITASDMAAACQVSRMTYYLWVRGRTLRSAKANRARKVIRVLLDLSKNELWAKEVNALSPDERRSRFLALVG